MLMINAKQRLTSTSLRVFMTCDWWFGLSDSYHQIWDQRDSKAKAVILGTGTPTNTLNQWFAQHVHALLNNAPALPHLIASI